MTFVRTSVIIASLLATACIAEPSPLREPQLGVSMGDATWRITDATLSAGPGAVSQQAAAIAQDYLRSGSGPISAVVAAPDLPRASSWASALVQAFARQGVMPEQIESTPVVSMTSPGAVITYRTASVVLPDCGPMATRASYLPGCGLDHYVGRMAANPADLLGERGSLGDRDGARSALAVDVYRRGEVKVEVDNGALRATTKTTEQ